MAKKKQRRGVGPASAPFERQIAGLSPDALRHTRAGLLVQRQGHLQRWSMLPHADRKGTAPRQVEEIDRRIALIDAQLHAMEDAVDTSDGVAGDEGADAAAAEGTDGDQATSHGMVGDEGAYAAAAESTSSRREASHGMAGGQNAGEPAPAASKAIDEQPHE